MIEIALAAGTAAVLMLIVLYVSKRGRKKQETYKKELDEEVEKYIPGKTSVRVYPGVAKLVKEDPELGDIPMLDIVKNFEEVGQKSLKDAYHMLLSRGVKPERVERLVVNIGKALAEEVGKAGRDHYIATGVHLKSRRQIDIRPVEAPEEWKYIIAHELTHRILADSPFGEYENDLSKQLIGINSKMDPLIKSLQKTGSKADRLLQRIEKAKTPAERRKLEPEYKKIDKRVEAIREKLKMAGKESRETQERVIHNTAIGEAVSFAVEGALRGKGMNKRDIHEMDKSYKAPVSAYYGKVKKFVEKKGVKAMIEAVRMINPEKAKRSRKYFKSFEDMYKRNMGS